MPASLSQLARFRDRNGYRLGQAHRVTVAATILNRAIEQGSRAADELHARMHASSPATQGFTPINKNITAPAAAPAAENKSAKKRKRAADADNTEAEPSSQATDADKTEAGPSSQGANADAESACSSRAAKKPRAKANKAKHANTGGCWTQEQRETIIARVRKGEQWETIGDAMGRSAQAMRLQWMRMIKLGFAGLSLEADFRVVQDGLELKKMLIAEGPIDKEAERRAAEKDAANRVKMSVQSVVN